MNTDQGERGGGEESFLHLKILAIGRVEFGDKHTGWLTSLLKLIFALILSFSILMHRVDWFRLALGSLHSYLRQRRPGFYSTSIL